jgi:putative transposase
MDVAFVLQNGEFVRIYAVSTLLAVAQAVRSCLKEKGIYQEFSHVATPEDNAYIEVFHSNLQREVIDRYEFDSIYHAQVVLDGYYDWYNGKEDLAPLIGKRPTRCSEIIIRSLLKMKNY